MKCIFFIAIEIVLQYHLNCVYFSYVESAKTLSRETNLDMNKFEVCDNVSLETVLMEYEAYYHVKFQRYPKITKKLVQSKHDCLDSFCIYQALIEDD